jgi:hypothetical protein
MAEPSNGGDESALGWTITIAAVAFRGQDRSFSPQLSSFTVGQTVGQPTRTVADISDPAHASGTPLPRIPRQRFCPDTEEVTGSKVSFTSIEN